MTDLTKITTPFGLLDAETQKALRGHSGPFEVYTNKCWEEITGPIFYNMHTYRVRPAPPKPREVWVNFYPNGIFAAHLNRSNAIRLCDEDGETVRFVEVIE